MNKRLPAALLAVALLATGCTKTASPPRSTVSQPAGNLDQAVDGDKTADDMAAQCKKGTAVAGRTARIVTTAGPITSIVGQLTSGTGIKVEGIIPSSANSHTYVPTPADKERIAAADAVISNGLGMELGVADVAQSATRPGAVVCELGTAALQKADYLYDDTFTQDSGVPNPHAWLNPQTMLRYINSARDAIVTVAPKSAKKVEANYVKLSFQMLSLDSAMLAAVETIPVRNRSLYLFHDSLAYLASHFKMTVGLVVQPPLFIEPTPVQIADALAALKNEGAAAFFGQAEFPGPHDAEVAASGVKTATIADEILPGSPGSATHSIGQLMKDTFVTVVETLGGDAAAVRKVAGSTGLKDSATYAG